MQGFRFRSMEQSIGELLRELEIIWTDIGDTEAEKDRMLLELEKECLQVYKRKVDEASNARARLHQSVAAKQAAVAALRASLGENSLHPQIGKTLTSLKEQLASVTPLLEELRLEKEERVKLFAEIRSQIDKIKGEINGYNHLDGSVINPDNEEENDFSLRKLNEYQVQLQNLEKEKSDRLHKVLGYVNEVHCLCGVLGMDFGKTINEVHPSLREADAGHTTNISNRTLEGLSKTILKLKTEKKSRAEMLRDTMSALYELWNLLDSPEEERRRFEMVLVLIGTPEDDITDCGVLSLETLEQMVAEVERLTKLKAIRMKELVFKRREELEKVCSMAHIEPDMSTTHEKINALIDSGIVDSSELVAKIEEQIAKAREEAASRTDIMDRVGKWLAACEEEKWLEDYNQDENRYSAGRGAHLNLKRAERARITVTKIPAILDSLMKRAFAWEDERNKPFMYDGVRLVSILEEYKLTRQQKEEENKRYRDLKRLQSLVEKGAKLGLKPSPNRSNSFGRKPNGYSVDGNGNGAMTPKPRRCSAGSATPELLTPRSYSGNENGYFKERRRSSTWALNFTPPSKGETTPSLPSICSSEPGSPPKG